MRLGLIVTRHDGTEFDALRAVGRDPGLNVFRLLDAYGALVRDGRIREARVVNADSGFVFSAVPLLAGIEPVTLAEAA